LITNRSYGNSVIFIKIFITLFFIINFLYSIQGTYYFLIYSSKLDSKNSRLYKETDGLKKQNFIIKGLKAYFYYPKWITKISNIISSLSFIIILYLMYSQ